MADGTDQHSREFEPIVGRCGLRLIRETRAVQSSEKPVAAPVAGKHPTGTVCAVRRGCKSNNESLGCKVTKIWNRQPPVGVLLEGLPFGFGDLSAPRP